MRRLQVAVGIWGAALAVVFLLWLQDWLPGRAPSTEQCVAFWNAPSNASIRTAVLEDGYPVVEIDGVYSEGRYQGCSATFSGDLGEPWALYSAVRIPGTDTPLRWQLDVDESRWGSGFQLPPNERPQPNATVRPDGTAFLT
jgi:hypothetical protein